MAIKYFVQSKTHGLVWRSCSEEFDSQAEAERERDRLQAENPSGTYEVSYRTHPGE